MLAAEAATELLTEMLNVRWLYPDLLYAGYQSPFEALNLMLCRRYSNPRRGD